MTKPVKACNFIKKETQTLLFSCEICEIFKNSFFYKTPPMAFSENKENVTSKCVHNFLECIQEIYEDLLGIVAKLGFLYLAILIGLVDFYSLRTSENCRFSEDFRVSRS